MGTELQPWQPNHPRLFDDIWKKLRGQLIGSSGYRDYVRVRLEVEPPSVFRFWENLSRPRPGNFWDLHVVPSYHPVMLGRSYTRLVNGDTDALNGVVVQRIFAPPEAVRPGRPSMSSWKWTRHPVCASGHSFTMEIAAGAARTSEGEAELRTLILAALGLEGYIAISGGFSSPYLDAETLALRGRVAVAPDNVRGSEAHCYWTYRTLEAEGQLASSHVPAWFMREKWLQAYDAAPAGQPFSF